MEWSSVPEELLREIAQKLVLISDFVRFRAVCKPWQSAVRPTDLPPQQPCLVGYDKNDINNCSFYSLCTEAVQLPVHVLQLPEFHNKRFCGGSCDGWLVLLDKSRGDAQALSLLQPLTRSHISLPLFKMKSGIPVLGARLSCSPTSLGASGRCTVVAWHCGDSEELYSCKLGPDGRWSRWTFIPTLMNYIWDVVVSHDHENLYVMNYFQIFKYGLKNKTSRVILLPEVVRGYPEYLAETSSGELLLVVRLGHDDGYEPSTFTLEVYKFKHEEWVKLQGMSIDAGRALFLCHGQPLFSDVVQAEHIYHASNHFIRLFNLKDGSCTIQPIRQHTAEDQLDWNHRILWFVPSLCP